MCPVVVPTAEHIFLFCFGILTKHLRIICLKVGFYEKSIISNNFIEGQSQS